MKISISKEVKVALFSVISIALLYFGFNFLRGIDFFSSTNKYHVVYEDIDGLTVSNPVLLNGLTVGRVSNIEILQNKNNKLLVTIDIRSDITLGDSTKAILINSGLLGSKAIVLEVGNIVKVLSNNDTLTSTTQKGIQDILAEKAIPVAVKLDSLFFKVNSILDNLASNGGKINNMARNLEATTFSLKKMTEHNADQINAITANLRAVSDQLNDTIQGIKPLLGKIHNVADSLNSVELVSTVENTKAALENLKNTLDKINQGEGSLGKLMKSDSLYTNLNNAAKNLDKLLIDIEENPQRYVHLSVFGRKDKKKKSKK